MGAPQGVPQFAEIPRYGRLAPAVWRCVRNPLKTEPQAESSSTLLQPHISHIYVYKIFYVYS